MNEILGADDLVLMSASIENLKKDLNRREAFESKRMKVSIKNTKVMVRGFKGKAAKNKVAPRGKRVTENPVMCTKSCK